MSFWKSLGLSKKYSQTKKFEVRVVNRVNLIQVRVTNRVNPMFFNPNFVATLTLKFIQIFNLFKTLTFQTLTWIFIGFTRIVTLTYIGLTLFVTLTLEFHRVDPNRNPNLHRVDPICNPNFGFSIFSRFLNLILEYSRFPNHTFSAFWLRSSVVSVLISLISDTVSIGDPED